MFALDLEGSTVIQKPVESVWAFMDDPNRAKEWQPYLVELEQIPADGVGVGTEQLYTFQYLWRRFSNHYLLTEYEPMARVAYESLPDSTIHATGENRFERVEAGTKLTMRFQPEVGGFYGVLPKSIVAWSYRRTLKNNLHRIKAILESEN